MAIFADAVNLRVTVPLSQHEFDALVCFSYNVGVGAFGTSTLLRLLNQGKREEAAAQLLRWTKAGGRELPGLIRRRRSERVLFRSGELKFHPTE